MITIRRLPNVIEEVPDGGMGNNYEVDWMEIEVDGVVLRVFQPNFFDMLAKDVKSMEKLRDWRFTSGKLEQLGLIQQDKEGHWSVTPKLLAIKPVLNAALQTNLFDTAKVFDEPLPAKDEVNLTL
jgi:hypothetical protein